MEIIARKRRRMRRVENMLTQRLVREEVPEDQSPPGTMTGRKVATAAIFDNPRQIILSSL